MRIYRANDWLRGLSAIALVAGVALLFAPTATTVSPVVIDASVDEPAVNAGARSRADSLTEDIILFDLFAPSRTAPSRRYSAAGNATGDDASAGMGAVSPSESAAGGFRPELIGTAVSDKPGETRALLRLLPTDAAPRLYAVGDKAGGYSVVSIDARSVVLTGPRGRVVLRLPESEESHS